MIRWIRRLFLPRSVRRSLANIEKQIEAASTNDKPDYSINGQSVFHSSHLVQLAIAREMLSGGRIDWKDIPFIVDVPRRNPLTGGATSQEAKNIESMQRLHDADIRDEHRRGTPLVASKFFADLHRAFNGTRGKSLDRMIEELSRQEIPTPNKSSVFSDA